VSQAHHGVDAPFLEELLHPRAVEPLHGRQFGGQRRRLLVQTDRCLLQGAFACAVQQVSAALLASEFDLQLLAAIAGRGDEYVATLQRLCPQRLLYRALTLV
jgi:hypothetical protein